jgi:hypothetical protein
MNEKWTVTVWRAPVSGVAMQASYTYGPFTSSGSLNRFMLNAMDDERTVDVTVDCLNSPSLFGTGEELA